MSNATVAPTSSPVPAAASSRSALLAVWSVLPAIVTSAVLLGLVATVDIGRSEARGEDVSLAGVVYVAIAVFATLGLVLALVPALVATFVRSREARLACAWIAALPSALLGPWLVLQILAVDAASSVTSPTGLLVLASGLVLVVPLVLTVLATGRR